MKGTNENPGLIRLAIRDVFDQIKNNVSTIPCLILNLKCLNTDESRKEKIEHSLSEFLILKFIMKKLEICSLPNNDM